MNKVSKFLQKKILHVFLMCLKYYGIRGYKNIYLKIYSFIYNPTVPFSNFCIPAKSSYFGHKLFSNTILTKVCEKNPLPNFYDGCKYFYKTKVGCAYHYEGKKIVYNDEYDFAEVHKNFSVDKKLKVQIFDTINSEKFPIEYLAYFAGYTYVLLLPSNLIKYVILNLK